MFLITTADQRFWKTDEPVLFLGEWCKIFSEKHIWEKLDYEVLPYHWDDRKRLSNDYLYLNRLYEEILVQVSNCLNRIHGENHTTRYWRIIIGPWLYFFIAILYDRYQSILSAELSGKVTNTYIAKCKPDTWIPKDFDEFRKYFIADDYNHYLYSRIIETTSRLPYETKDSQKEQVFFAECKINLKESLPSLKSILKRIIKKSWKIVPDSLNRIVFVSSYFSTIELMKLQLALRQVPYHPPYIDLPHAIVDIKKRKEIKIDLNSSESEFGCLLAGLIPEQIPTCYIESYSLMKEKALKVFPSKPKMIFTANASYVHEGFKLWAASHAESGAKFLGTQHGGFYGIGLWTANEDHEYEIYDKYYSWGWEDASREKIKPLPATKLIRTKKIRQDKDGRILMGHMGMSRYAYSLLNMPIASTGYSIYLRGTFKFIEHLSEKAQELLLVRLFHDEDYGLCLKEQFVCECPSIECYRGPKSMLDQLKESRLFVGTYNATTYLESFAANYPTVLYWNPNQWEIRASAQPYIDMLSSAGILHYTPESAAEMVNDIYEDPLSWWNKPEIQEAKDQFCYRFARTSKHWLKEWKEELLHQEPKWMK